MNEVYSLRQAAEMIGVSKATARRAYRRSGVKGIETPNVILLTIEQINELTNHCYARPRNEKQS